MLLKPVRHSNKTVGQLSLAASDRMTFRKKIDKADTKAPGVWSVIQSTYFVVAALSTRTFAI